jgi:hypothetical protein
MSREYTVKSLQILAKADGYDFDEELEDPADVEKAMKKKKKGGTPTGPLNPTGNKVDSHKGPYAPGKIVHSVRSSGEAVQRKVHPTSYATEDGMDGIPMGKSLRLPVITGDARLVEYSDGEDQSLADSIEKGYNHIPPSRNLRAEKEAADLIREE